MIFFRSPRFTVYYNCVYNTVIVTSTCRFVVERPAVWCNEKKVPRRVRGETNNYYGAKKMHIRFLRYITPPPIRY